MERIQAGPRAPARLRKGPSFPLLAIRLVASILCEGVATLFHFLFFPLQATSERARIRAIILKGAGRLAALACVALLGPAGCQTQPGTSFSKQLEETAWSAKEIVRMDDAQQSLEEDLYDFGTGTSPSEFLWDFEQIFTNPDAQTSIENDLSDFGELELDGLGETFELLGW